jgi:hypothetical protein
VTYGDEKERNHGYNLSEYTVLAQSSAKAICKNETYGRAKKEREGLSETKRSKYRHATDCLRA